MGQSNVGGGNPSAGKGSFILDPRVTVWNNEDNLDTLASLGTSFVVPDRDLPPFDDGKNSVAPHALSYIARVANDDVRGIISWRDGEEIAAWCDAEGTVGAQYERFEAIMAEAGLTSVDVLVWIQGDADRAAGILAEYPAKWDALYARLIADGYITSETPVVFGESSAERFSINVMFDEMKRTRPYMAVARLSTLPTYDGAHYKHSGCPIGGKRIVQALSALDAAYMPIWTLEG